ncbi:hypothetical protein Tco_0145142, partial [Tanacetum coccineum]
YGYIKNHKKTVKNGQARTRESEEYKKKPKNQSRSQKSQTRIKKWAGKFVDTVHSSLPFHQAVKTRGKWKLKGENGNSSGPLHDGKVRLVISKLSLSSLKLIATSAMVKAHIVMGFCANLLTKEAQAVTIKE